MTIPVVDYRRQSSRPSILPSGTLPTVTTRSETAPTGFPRTRDSRGPGRTPP
ncbi:hypothetical protein [Salinispora sp. H7-4]|uniref:hypothetical protein n=1 Tax=Salinispora sp. H7-4 TaxID=2748321 RepID=UPI0015D0F2D7|nr:hypothetical protein [Salinispora sp. H7-4]NYT93350.1 hypothetical protein [Salinispora sp. H7-4]